MPGGAILWRVISHVLCPIWNRDVNSAHRVKMIGLIARSLEVGVSEGLSSPSPCTRVVLRVEAIARVAQAIPSDALYINEGTSPRRAKERFRRFSRGSTPRSERSCGLSGQRHHDCKKC